MDTEEDGNQRINGKEIWEKRTQQASSTVEEDEGSRRR